MELSSVFFLKILRILARKYSIGFTFEELTKLVTTVSNVSKFTNNIASERENQAKLLDVLVLMNSEGYIFLNSDTDQSLITIKGLIAINNKILWN
ncbi:hypothetical protein BSF41_44820 [Flavobacterium sp. ACN2]|jgi:hypothetical protein|uniref:hypothetical protein n=1 Tax=unclassified Flavobacterium TaxID=196869 RepID=UPI000BB3843A|nr:MULTISPECIES: hypothetical protein [unclassified Flavobacterium]MDY0989442.1 hypothetical protein [Flavobacterium sp. CFBP9031]PBI83767.1 hypothetical protein BSF41_44820 [Flavobacterium sp. ACN2]